MIGSILACLYAQVEELALGKENTSCTHMALKKYIRQYVKMIILLGKKFSDTVDCLLCDLGVK